MDTNMEITFKTNYCHIILSTITSMVFGEFLGIGVGFLFDYIYISNGLVTVPLGAVLTVGIVIGIAFGWLGGIVSNTLIKDLGVSGGTVVGIIGATLPVIVQTIK